jgi:hypothetical protein
MQRTKGEKGKCSVRSLRHSSKHLHYEEFRKRKKMNRKEQKKTDTLSLFSLATVESSFSDNLKKRENKCFLFFVVSSCHIISFTSQKKNRILYYPVVQIKSEA